MTEKITITEALAEIKTIDSRVQKKVDFIQNHLYRQDYVKDPLQSDGGSVEVIRRERQSINDLQQRKVDLRLAINDANDTTELVVEGLAKTLSEWLIWRREVAPFLQEILRDFNSRLTSVRQDAMRKGLQVVKDEATTPTDIVVNINEKNLADDIESLETILGTLDGQLSLKNATTFVDL